MSERLSRWRAAARRVIATAAALTLAAFFLAWLEGAYTHASYLGAVATIGSIALLAGAVSAAAPVRGESVGRFFTLAWAAGATTALVFGVGLILSRTVDFPSAATGAWSATLIATLVLAGLYVTAYVDLLLDGGVPRPHRPDLRSEWREAQWQWAASEPVDHDYSLPARSGMQRLAARLTGRGEVLGLGRLARSLERQLASGVMTASDRRRIVPNDYILSLSPHDHERLASHLESFVVAQQDALVQRAKELGCLVPGDLLLSVEADDRLPAGQWRVRSDVTPFPRMHGGVVLDTRPTSSAHRVKPSDVPGSPALVLSPDEVDVAALEARGQAPAYPLGRSSVTIGSDPHCDLRLSGPDVKSQHAQISYREDMFVIEAVDSVPVRVNGVKRLEYALSSADRIEIGEHTMVFTRQGH